MHFDNRPGNCHKKFIKYFQHRFSCSRDLAIWEESGVFFKLKAIMYSSWYLYMCKTYTVAPPFNIEGVIASLTCILVMLPVFVGPAT